MLKSSPYRAATAASIGVTETPERVGDCFALSQLRDDRQGRFDRDREADVLRSCDPSEVMRRLCRPNAAGGPRVTGLIADVGWMRCVRCSPSCVSMVRSSADTIPSVAVGAPVRSRALPIATTGSPILRSADVPNGNGMSPDLATLMTARSAVRSTPRTVATALEPSPNPIWMLVASATTCALWDMTAAMIRYGASAWHPDWTVLLPQ